jgi:hypothetical protein
MWRYVCANSECGWVWSNVAQREHNAQVYKVARKLEYAGYYG